jgi:hypothetical protein
MSYIVSIANTITGTLDTSFTGDYEDTSGYQIVTLWANTPGNATAIIYYADQISGENQSIETYPVYSRHASSINSLVKKRFSKCQLINTSDETQIGAVMKTKFGTRAPHPFLTYTTDLVTANVTVPLDEIAISLNISAGSSSIQVYGSELQPLRTDDIGTLIIASSGAVQTAGETSNGQSVIMSVDSCGRLNNNIYINDDPLGTTNPLPSFSVNLTVSGTLLDSDTSLYIIGARNTQDKAVLLSASDSGKLQSIISHNDTSVNSQNPIPVVLNLSISGDELQQDTSLYIMGARNTQNRVMSLSASDSGKLQTIISHNDISVNSQNPIPVVFNLFTSGTELGEDTGLYIVGAHNTQNQAVILSASDSGKLQTIISHNDTSVNAHNPIPVVLNLSISGDELGEDTSLYIMGARNTQNRVVSLSASDSGKLQTIISHNDTSVNSQNPIPVVFNLSTSGDELGEDTGLYIVGAHNTENQAVILSASDSGKLQTIISHNDTSISSQNPLPITTDVSLDTRATIYQAGNLVDNDNPLSVQEPSCEAVSGILGTKTQIPSGTITRLSSVQLWNDNSFSCFAKFYKNNTDSDPFIILGIRGNGERDVHWNPAIKIDNQLYIEGSTSISGTFHPDDNTVLVTVTYKA